MNESEDIDNSITSRLPTVLLWITVYDNLSLKIKLSKGFWFQKVSASKIVTDLIK